MKKGKAIKVKSMEYAVQPPLTEGEKSLKRLKEMPYSKPEPDGKAFIIRWKSRKDNK